MHLYNNILLNILIQISNIKFAITIVVFLAIFLSVPVAMNLIAGDAGQYGGRAQASVEVAQANNAQTEKAVPSDEITDPSLDQKLQTAPRQGAEPEDRSSSFASAREGTMTLASMREIIKRLDDKVKETRPGTFVMVVNDFEVMIVTAEQANRMRVMVRVRSAEKLTKDELTRISQANFDAALDARYAIGKGVLWATYIHPLSSLNPLQFIEAIGSTVNLAANYGTSYSSGQLLFGGGDSGEIIGRQLIDELIKKGRPI